MINGLELSIFREVVYLSLIFHVFLVLRAPYLILVCTIFCELERFLTLVFQVVSMIVVVYRPRVKMT